MPHFIFFLVTAFFSILLALNRTSIDLFSLDIEGGELDVLRTIPWDRVDIKVC
jgi:Methyltransferase FkbM domain